MADKDKKVKSDIAEFVKKAWVDGGSVSASVTIKHNTGKSETKEFTR